jgi:hypothetical protein
MYGRWFDDEDGGRICKESIYGISTMEIFCGGMVTEIKWGERISSLKQISVLYLCKAL